MPSPQQITEKVFPVVRQGYDRAAVDEFLRAVALEHHRVLAELAAGRADVEADPGVQAAHREVEALLAGASQLADRMIDAAQAEALRRLDAADEAGRQVLAAARREAECRRSRSAP